MDGIFFQLAILSELEKEGALTVRAQIPFHFKKPMTLDHMDKASEMATRHQGEWLKAGMVEVFMDGLLDSSTAYIIEPYPGDAGWRGQPHFSDGEIIKRSDKAKVLKSCRAAGSSNGLSHGWVDAAGWPRISRNPSLQQKHG